MMEPRGPWTDNDKAAALAAVAGILMLASGVTGASQWRRIFALLEVFLGTSAFIRFLQFVFVAIGSVGGILVLLGANAFRNDRVRTGKLLTYLGTGFTVASMILFLTIILQNGELPFAGGAVLGFVGVGLSIAARFQAKAVPR